jgi:ATP-binding cassette subfamily B protein
LLEQYGAHVTVASSGQAALAHLRDRMPAQWPHVLICDIAMPDTDGYDVLRQIRRTCDRSGNRFTDLPAIALSALTREGDRARARAAGFQLHLEKPVSGAELGASIAALVGYSCT